MEFEELLVSGAPARLYTLSASLFEYHQRVMDADRAPAAGIHCLFELYAAAYYRHTANADMMVDADHPWSAELLDRHNAEKHCHAAASVVLSIDDAIVEDSVVYCRTDEKAWILYESFRFPDRAASALSAKPLLDVDVTDFQRGDRSITGTG
jgi:hypothetical protein